MKKFSNVCFFTISHTFFKRYMVEYLLPTSSHSQRLHNPSDYETEQDAMNAVEKLYPKWVYLSPIDFNDETMARIADS